MSINDMKDKVNEIYPLLNEENKKLFMLNKDTDKVSVVTYMVVWFFVGCLGIHAFMMNQKGNAMLLLATFIFGVGFLGGSFYYSILATNEALEQLSAPIVEEVPMEELTLAEQFALTQNKEVEKMDSKTTAFVLGATAIFLLVVNFISWLISGIKLPKQIKERNMLVEVDLIKQIFRVQKTPRDSRIHNTSILEDMDNINKSKFNKDTEIVKMDNFK